MAIRADVVTHRPAPELCAGNAGDLAGDVPEGDVDAGDGGGTDDAVAVPEMLAEHHLPQVLDTARVFADQQRGEVFNGGDDAAGVPFERGFPPAVQAGLIGDNLDEHPVPHPGIADERLDGGDFHFEWNADDADLMDERRSETKEKNERRIEQKVTKDTKVKVE